MIGAGRPAAWNSARPVVTRPAADDCESPGSGPSSMTKSESEQGATKVYGAAEVVEHWARLHPRSGALPGYTRLGVPAG
jgi:hypothetical protein